jgi:hypothetical protein
MEPKKRFKIILFALCGIGLLVIIGAISIIMYNSKESNIPYENKTNNRTPIIPNPEERNGPANRVILNSENRKEPSNRVSPDLENRNDESSNHDIPNPKSENEPAKNFPLKDLDELMDQLEKFERLEIPFDHIYKEFIDRYPGPEPRPLSINDF